jgi:predicted Zn-dependent protease
VNLGHAEAPSASEIQSALNAARIAWGTEAPAPIQLSVEALNDCRVTRGADAVMATTQIFTEVTTETDLETGQSHQTSRPAYYKIRVNSNCNWKSLSLQNILTHEYGHVLLGVDYHSTDKKSIMYPIVNLGPKSVTGEDRKLLNQGR